MKTIFSHFTEDWNNKVHEMYFCTGNVVLSKVYLSCFTGKAWLEMWYCV